MKCKELKRRCAMLHSAPGQGFNRLAGVGSDHPSQPHDTRLTTTKTNISAALVTVGTF
jgi:hypothetical protein